jgi:hypothetical protein
MARETYDKPHKLKKSQLNSWKKLDIKEFPGTDPRLPYEFDLSWDIKYWSELDHFLAEDIDDLVCMIDCLEYDSLWVGYSVTPEMRQNRISEMLFALEERIKELKGFLKEAENYLKSRKR